MSQLLVQLVMLRSKHTSVIVFDFGLASCCWMRGLTCGGFAPRRVFQREICKLVVKTDAQIPSLGMCEALVKVKVNVFHVFLVLILNLLRSCCL